MLPSFFHISGTTYDGTGLNGFDVAMGLIYLATSIGAFVVASGLWAQRASIWMAAALLSLLMIGLDMFSVLWWGFTGLDNLSFAVHLVVLGYLNQNPVRRAFGRPATTFLQLTS